MKYPKVIFKKMSLEENIDIVKWAFFADSDNLNIHDYTIKCFPLLSNININDSKEKIYNKIEEIVTSIYLKNEKKIDIEVKRYNKLWKKYNNKYFESLIDFFNCSFPKSINVIEGTVGIIPVFPRYLDTMSFSISIDVDDSKLVEVVAHETLHFIWFEKWKQLYPKTPRIHFDSPYLEWKYSEMVTDPILNNKPFNQIFNFKEKGYDSFYNLYDGDKLVMDNLREIFSLDEDINCKIEKGYKYINDYFSK